MHLEFSALTHLTEAFHSLRIVGTYLAPASEHSVMVSAHAFETPGARFSALGFPQDGTSIEVDILNRAVRHIAAPGKSVSLLLFNSFVGD